jgi:hypothetical protein
MLLVVLFKVVLVVLLMVVLVACRQLNVYFDGKLHDVLNGSQVVFTKL